MLLDGAVVKQTGVLYVLRSSTDRCQSCPQEVCRAGVRVAKVQAGFAQSPRLNDPEAWAAGWLQALTLPAQSLPARRPARRWGMHCRTPR